MLLQRLLLRPHHWQPCGLPSVILLPPWVHDSPPVSTLSVFLPACMIPCHSSLHPAAVPFYSVVITARSCCYTTPLLPPAAAPWARTVPPTRYTPPLAHPAPTPRLTLHLRTATWKRQPVTPASPGTTQRPRTRRCAILARQVRRRGCRKVLLYPYSMPCHSLPLLSPSCISSIRRLRMPGIHLLCRTHIHPPR